MFGFLNDAMNYDTRKVARDSYDWGFISTAAVSDGEQPYETAVKHRQYNDDKMVIVDAYSTREDAEAGHAKWVSIMTAPSLPESLEDCANSEISQIIGKQNFQRVQS